MYFPTDSDGNPLDSGHDNIDTALRAAFATVLTTWPDWEVCTIVWSETDTNCKVATVERAGPRGTRSVRVALAGAGWIGMTIDVAA